MSKEELSRLLFKKMKIDPKTVLKIDSSGFGKLLVELSDIIKPESFVDLPAFDIRDGLRVKYYRPHHRKETLVTINWMDIETPDEMLVHVLNHFGKITSNVKWSKIKQEEGDSDLAKLLNNILSGERQVWMEVTKPLPSYASIDNRRVKIYHPGQRRTCARCQKVADLCKGNSNAKLCEDNGGDKINVIDAWKNTLASVNYIAWNGDKSDDAKDDIIEDVVENYEETIPAEITNCDGFVISNLDEDTTVDEIKLILKGTASEEEIAGISVHPTGSTRSKIIKDIDPKLVNMITKKVESKSFKGRLLHCRPHVPVTPPKKKTENDNKEPMENRKIELEQRDSDERKDSASSCPVPPTTKDDDKTQEQELKDTPVKKDDKEAISKSPIPGLSQKEVDKANKKIADKLKKEARKKEAKNKKKEENVKKVKDLKQIDFMINSTAIDDKLNEFEFSSQILSESDEDEAFEDSKEVFENPENIEQFMTPKPFKSIYAKHVEESGTIEKKRTSSFAGLSPIECEETKRVKPIKNVRRSSLSRLC